MAETSEGLYARENRETRVEEEEEAVAMWERKQNTE
jgi:hypothetical protein